jgi:hypothetical protein
MSSQFQFRAYIPWGSSACVGAILTLSFLVLWKYPSGAVVGGMGNLVAIDQFVSYMNSWGKPPDAPSKEDNNNSDVASPELSETSGGDNAVI